MSTKRTVVLSILTLVVVAGAGGAYWYQSTLDEAAEIRENADSRQVEDGEVVRLERAPEMEVGTVQDPVDTQTDTPTPAPELTTTPAETVQTTPEVVETGPVLLAEGSFGTLDPLHYGEGDVQVVGDGDEVFVNFQDNFATNPDAPDLYVWLVQEQELGGSVGGVNTDSSTFLDLGPLDTLEGASSFAVSRAEYEANDYAVVLWCRAFSVQFTNAVLN